MISKTILVLSLCAGTWVLGHSENPKFHEAVAERLDDLHAHITDISKVLNAATVYYNTADAKNCYNVANNNMNEMYGKAKQDLEINANNTKINSSEDLIKIFLSYLENILESYEKAQVCITGKT